MQSTEELTQLAIDVLTNKVYMTQDSGAAQYAFGTVLMLLDGPARQKVIDDQPAAFYEYMDKAGPRSVNGYPCFFSMHWISKEVWPAFYEIYEAKRKALHGEEETKANSYETP